MGDGPRIVIKPQQKRLQAHNYPESEKPTFYAWTPPMQDANIFRVNRVQNERLQDLVLSARGLVNLPFLLDFMACRQLVESAVRAGLFLGEALVRLFSFWSHQS